MAWSEWKKMGNGVINTTPILELLNTSNSTLNEELFAASDGVLFAWSNRGYSGRTFIVKINNVEIINYSTVENANPLRKIVPIKKGDLINLSIVGKSGDDFMGIYYFE